MNPLWTMTIEEIRLDWKNNFLTSEKFAEHYGLTKEQAIRLLFICFILDPSTPKNVGGLTSKPL